MIITLAELKAYLSITDDTQDTLLTIFMNSANSYVEKYTGRKFDSAEYTQLFDWKGQVALSVKNYPIITLTSVKYNSWTLSTPVREDFDANSYKASNDNWLIQFISPISRDFSNIQVTYTGGFATIPWDLKLATLKYAATSYNLMSSDGITKESVSGDILEYSIDKAVSQDVTDVLDLYKSFDV